LYYLMNPASGYSTPFAKSARRKNCRAHDFKKTTPFWRLFVQKSYQR
jgi:hypothetical protein